ncbi:hypothetical protein D6789_03445 [Candidatus Woesearchaeota archaeon]|nr:MAG: hypothetical protein D6789_03445 [Candidatus Woesearchaeota archaeon]
MAGSLKKLIETYEPFKGKTVLIALEGAPDPDSMSSALAHRRILSTLDIDTVILHAKPVSHQENRAAMKLLGIEFTYYDRREEEQKTEGRFDFSQFAGYAVVDSQRPDSDIAEHLTELPLISRVDHHGAVKGEEALAALYDDVRPNIGATATIYTQYLKSGKLLDYEESESLATALLHGIYTDTKDFLKATRQDFEAAAYLAGFANMKTFREISEESLSEKGLEGFARGVDPQRHVRIGSYVLASAGVLTKNDSDVIPQIADLLVNVDGMHTVVVYGIIDDIVRGSVRTSSAKERPKEFIHETFPEIRRFGGKADEGGFTMPLAEFSGVLSPKSDLDLLEQCVDRYFQSRFREHFNENGK